MIEEPFAAGTSVIHRLDPRCRIIAAIFFSIVTAVLYGFPALLTAFGLGLLMLSAARIRLRQAARRLVPVNLFIAVFWLILPLTAGGNVVYRSGPVVLYLDGIVLSAQITLKSNAIMMALIALIATMGFATLGHALNSLRFPEKFVFLFMLTYRYIFVIEEEYRRIWRAVKIRGFQPKTTLHSYRTVAYMIGMLFIRAAARADRVYRAMKCRGFKGRFYSLAEFRFTRSSLIFSILTTLGLFFMILLEATHHGV
jgi:cobalt/nickel transport system permease protein